MEVPEQHSYNSRVLEDTGHFAVLVDHHEVGEVPGHTLGDDPLQGQASPVVHVGVGDHRGQLFAEPNRSLKEEPKGKDQYLNPLISFKLTLSSNEQGTFMTSP